MMFLSLLTTVLLIMPRTLFALAAASVHCLDGLALSCITTPKSFSSSVCLILLLSISYSNLQFLLPTCMTAHLSMLNGMFQSFDLMFYVFLSFCVSFLSFGCCFCSI